MGKRGVDRPFVVATRLNTAEKAALDHLRGPLSPAVYLRLLLREQMTQG